MAVNKVIYNDTVLIDLSESTVTPETLAEGVIAYNAAGERIVGTMKATSQSTVTDDGNGNVIVGGMTATDDGNGNLTVLMNVSEDASGNIRIGE